MIGNVTILDHSYLTVIIIMAWLCEQRLGSLSTSTTGMPLGSLSKLSVSSVHGLN